MIPANEIKNILESNSPRAAVRALHGVYFWSSKYSFTRSAYVVRLDTIKYSATSLHNLLVVSAVGQCLSVESLPACIDKLRSKMEHRPQAKARAAVEVYGRHIISKAEIL